VTAVTAHGLAELSLAELERLARALHQDDLRCPVTGARLASAQLDDLDGRLAALCGLDRPASLAVVDAVLAERQAVPRTSPALIWTGPQAGAATGRDAAIAVRELFERANRTVLVCGYSFDHGADIFEPLHVAMSQRGVAADLFLDVPAIWEEDFPLDQHLSRFLGQFLDRNWPFGAPYPRFFYDPRTVPYQSRVSLHAKAAVVDDEWVLITSANFTDRGQTRNLEIGVVLCDRGFAAAVTEKLRRLQVLGLFREMTR
jgi:hypothetical protein